MPANAQRPAAGILGTSVGLLSFLFGASGVFTELRSALNLIWEVKLEQTSGLIAILRERFFSFGMVSASDLLLVSLVVSTVLAAAGKFFWGPAPHSFTGTSGPQFARFSYRRSDSFRVEFKFVPEAKVRWRGGSDPEP